MKRGSASSTERGRAAQLLAQVVLPPNRTIDQVLSRHTLTPLESELLYGVTRRLYTLRSAVQPFLSGASQLGAAYSGVSGLQGDTN